jgi:uncharacterized protein YecE (DUF72 family)
MSTANGEIIVGMGGWQLEPFNGPFYPEKQPKGFRKLEFFSRYFDLVEVNATFYTTALTARNAFQWLEDVSGNKSFRFSVKLFKGFTHTMDARQSDVDAVHRVLEPLAAEEKLCGLVMQFPYGFTNDPERRHHLQKLSAGFASFPLLIELRHKCWNEPDALSFLKENNLHLINVDLPAIRRHMPLTETAWGGTAYFRLMGRNARTWDTARRDEKTNVSDRYLHQYSEKEIEDLFNSINRVARRGNQTFAVFHNDPQANSLYNGYQLRHVADPKRKFKAPAALIKKFPRLVPFTLPDPPTEPTLF